MSISGDQFSVESPQTSVPGCWKQPGSCQILTYSWSWGSLTAQILNHGKYGRQEGSVVLLFLMHYVSKYVKFRVSVRGKSSWILCMIKRIGRFQDAWSISDLLLSLMFSFCRWAVLVKKTAAGLVLAPSTQVLACTSTSWRQPSYLMPHVHVSPSWPADEAMRKGILLWKGRWGVLEPFCWS